MCGIPWLKTSLALAATLLLPMVTVGCASLFGNTHSDQVASLKRYDTDGIEAPVSLPELQRGKADVGFSAPDFLTLHSGLVVSGRYLSDDYLKKLETSRQARDGVLELGFSVPIATGGSGFGACAPVTADGYFLTAAHVLSHEDSYVLYATSNSKQTYIDHAPVRVVYSNRACDFAILKASIRTPRYLKFRTTPLDPDVTLFAGGWIHEKAGGRFLSIEPISIGDPTKKAHKVLTTIPMIKGDSGSPLIDKKGRLCGVLSTMRLGVVMKLKPMSTAVMMDPAQIRAIIAQDRRRNN